MSGMAFPMPQFALGPLDHDVTQGVGLVADNFEDLPEEEDAEEGYTGDGGERVPVVLGSIIVQFTYLHRKVRRHEADG